LILSEFAAEDPHFFSFVCDANDLGELIFVQVALGVVFIGEEYSSKFTLWGLLFEDSWWIIIGNIQSKGRTKIAMFLAGYG